MGNRVIKESIRTSKSVNALSDFQFRLWLYLITYVDDYGRGSADADILKGFVFPRRKGVTESQIEKALADLANTGMIRLYEVDGDSFFCFPNWGDHQRIQAKRAKFPAPPEETENFDNPPSPTVSHGESPPESEINTNYNPNPKSKEEVDAQAQETTMMFSSELQSAVNDWIAYKKERRFTYGEVGMRNLLSEIKHNAVKYGETAVAALIRQCITSGWSGIIFDRLRDKSVGIPTKNKKGGNYEPGDYERNAVARMAQRRADREAKNG